MNGPGSWWSTQWWCKIVSKILRVFDTPRIKPRTKWQGLKKCCLNEGRNAYISILPSSVPPRPSPKIRIHSSNHGGPTTFPKNSHTLLKSSFSKIRIHSSNHGGPTTFPKNSHTLFKSSFSKICIHSSNHGGPKAATKWCGQPKGSMVTGTVCVLATPWHTMYPSRGVMVFDGVYPPPSRLVLPRLNSARLDY